MSHSISHSRKKEALRNAGAMLAYASIQREEAERALITIYELSAAYPDNLYALRQGLQNWKDALDETMARAENYVAPYNRLPKSLTDAFKEAKKKKAITKSKLTRAQNKFKIKS